MGNLPSFLTFLSCASITLLSLSGCGGSGSSGNSPDSLVGNTLNVVNNFPTMTDEQNIAFGNLHVLGFLVIPLTVDTCQFVYGNAVFTDSNYASTYAYHKTSDNTATLHLAYNAKRTNAITWSFNLRYDYNLTFDANKVATGDCTVTVTPTQIVDLERTTLSGTATITGFDIY